MKDVHPSERELQFVVALCRFQSAWESGDRPRAEDFVAQWPAADRDALLPRLLALEVEIRERAGDQPGFDELAARVPANLLAALDVLKTVDRVDTQNPHGGPDAVQAPEADSIDDSPDLGRYHVTRLVGIGGFGIVYRAEDSELKRSVAVKVLHLRWSAMQNCVDDFLKEARVVAQLDHPHIVPVFDCNRTEDGRPFVVSKFIEGSNLRECLKRRRLSPAETIGIVAAIAEALHYAHLKGLVHRDVKPSNILIDDAGKAYLADFGMVLREQEYGQGPTFAGTPTYMSPEQARSEGHRVDGRSDIFSLGVVLYELLTGRKPFQAESNEDLLRQLIEMEPRPPRQIDDAIPRELERICLKALSKRASDRYTTANDMAEDLRHSLMPPTTDQSALTKLTVPPAPPHAADAIEHPAPPIASTPGPCETPSFEQLAARVIPKGLRSFDSHDADFFLELLPGPRDRSGLPDSVRFWKTRIDEADSDETFPVGLIYGPSGCGKSSLIKAGLLPRLSPNVVTVYIEATPNETELRLLNGLRKRFAQLAHDNLNLLETMTALRRGRGLPIGQKVLIILDQFEQWLHSNVENDNSELVRALRQCDGGRIQCILTVRDDFWLAVSRFLRNLEVRLVEGHNSTLADLFDPAHAKKVLTAFGQAYGRLPAYLADLGADAKAFLNHAVTGLAQDSKIVSVRLALFAEMMKSKEWTVASLKAVGGTAGVGVTFLEETFSTSTAPPEHRYHQSAARAVLKALLPEPGANIKGHMLSAAQLFAASGYERRPADFESLMHILDGELRLVTPTDPEGKSEAESNAAEFTARERFYQLTHDYLVPSLLEWLTRKQKETPRGRAELLLADRAAIWTARPENRQLPTLWQWLRIQRWTNKQSWTAPERKMMTRATRQYGSRLLAIAALAMVCGIVGWEFFGRTRAANLSKDLFNYPIGRAPETIESMSGFRRWVDPLLHQAVSEEVDPKRRLCARLGLLPVDRSQLPEVFEQFLICDAEDFRAIRTLLASYQEELKEELWKVLQDPNREDRRRLRAAAALATFDPNNSAWNQIGGDVASLLVAQPPTTIGAWTDLLSECSKYLTNPLAEVLADEKRSESERATASTLFAAYAKTNPSAWKQLSDSVTSPINPSNSRDLRIAEAKRRANVGVAMFQEGQLDRAVSLLRGSPDPTTRSFLIHRLGLPRVQARVLFELLENTKLDPSVRQALILSVGQYDVARIPSSALPQWRSLLERIYRTDVHPGVHGAAEWLLRQWNESALLRLDAELIEQDREVSRKGILPPDGRLWYMTPQGHTMVIVRVVGEHPVGEDDAHNTPSPSHTFAISSKEITVRQFLDFRGNHKYAKSRAPSPECPTLNISWYDAAAYCNWRSTIEHLQANDWCFEPNVNNEYGPGMKIAPDAINRCGYRLATHLEWDCAARAGTTTRFSFGDDESLMEHFGWFAINSDSRTHPAGTREPNLIGLFDVHGNAAEWCQVDPRRNSARPNMPNTGEFRDMLTVNDENPQPIHGGWISDTFANLVTGKIDWIPPSGRVRVANHVSDFCPTCGFRVVRTIR